MLFLNKKKSPASRRPPRIKRRGIRRKGDRRIKPGRWILSGVMVYFGARALWGAVSSGELFNINPEKILVEGNSMVSTNMIISGLEEVFGQNIMGIDLKKLRQDIKTYPKIKEVRVRRRYPDGLYISIEERVPAGYVMISGERNVVNECGKIFPGTEGPVIEFKSLESENITKISEFLNDIRDIRPEVYSEITAVDMNYRNEVIIYENDFFLKLSPVSEMDRELIKKYFDLTGRIREDIYSKDNSLSYIDLRFIKYSENGFKGAAIVK